MIASLVGPWQQNLTVDERRYRLRLMKKVAYLHYDRKHELVDLLERAEGDPAVIVRALQVLEFLPTYSRRQIWEAYLSGMSDAKEREEIERLVNLKQQGESEMGVIDCAFYGRIGRDAEVKTGKSGKAYMVLSVGVGGKNEETTWINVMSFDDEAIANGNKYTKGSPVYVEGRVELEKWTSRQDGLERTGLKVTSNHTRLSQIGRNKPAKAPADLDDEIAF
jgi:hypothetical protein